MDVTTTTTSSSGQQQQQQGHTVLFPWKLHEMLTCAENEGKDDVVSWLPDGAAFKVHNVTDFVSKMLPSYFKQTKYKSFQRQ
jgi:HSF-type DNA-binding